MKPEVISTIDVHDYLTNKSRERLIEKQMLDGEDIPEDKFLETIIEIAGELNDQHCLGKTMPFETSDGRTIQFLFFDKLPKDYKKYTD